MNIYLSLVEAHGNPLLFMGPRGMKAGEAYERVLAKVKLKNGSIVEAYIYALRSA